MGMAIKVRTRGASLRKKYKENPPSDFVQPRYSCPVCISLCTQQRLGLQGLRMLKVSQKRPLWGDQSCRAKRQQCAKMCQISMCTLDWQIKGWKRSPRGAVLKKLQTLQDALADFLCGWLTEYQRTLKYFVKCWPQLLMTYSYSVFRSELWTKHFGESRLVEDTVKREVPLLTKYSD